MRTTVFDPGRRKALFGILAGSALGVTGIPGLIRHVLAMGKKEYPQGMREVKGTVRINETPARIGDLVDAGDVVSTGADSMAVFVAGTSAYLLRENSRLTLESQSSKDQAIDLLRMLNGKMLAVFGKGAKEILTPTAVIGVRGTGLYVEAEAAKTYLCTCYGVVDIEAMKSAGQRETIKAKHHESPRYIHAAGIESQMITKGPMINHTDAELIMLEALVGRRPPFVKTGNSGDDNHGGGNGGGY